jgi:hypothetical protein
VLWNSVVGVRSYHCAHSFSRLAVVILASKAMDSKTDLHLYIMQYSYFCCHTYADDDDDVVTADTGEHRWMTAPSSTHNLLRNAMTNTVEVPFTFPKKPTSIHIVTVLQYHAFAEILFAHNPTAQAKCYGVTAEISS